MEGRFWWGDAYSVVPHLVSDYVMEVEFTVNRRSILLSQKVSTCSRQSAVSPSRCGSKSAFFLDVNHGLIHGMDGHGWSQS